VLLLADIVGHAVHGHTAVQAHGSRKSLTIDAGHPAIGIHTQGQSRTRGEVRERCPWRSVATGARLVGALRVVVGALGGRDLADLSQGSRALEGQTRFRVAAVVSLDTAVLIGAAGRADHHLTTQTLPEPDERRGKVTPLGTSDTPGITIAHHAIGQPIGLQKRNKGRQNSRGALVFLRLGAQAEGRARVHHSEHLHHVLAFAVLLRGNRGGVLDVHLPHREGLRTLNGIALWARTMRNPACGGQNAPDGALAAGQGHRGRLQGCVTVQIIENGQRTGRAAQIVRRLIADGQETLHHALIPRHPLMGRA